MTQRSVGILQEGFRDERDRLHAQDLVPSRIPFSVRVIFSPAIFASSSRGDLLAVEVDLFGVSGRTTRSGSGMNLLLYWYSMFSKQPSRAGSRKSRAAVVEGDRMLSEPLFHPVRRLKPVVDRIFSVRCGIFLTAAVFVLDEITECRAGEGAFSGTVSVERGDAPGRNRVVEHPSRMSTPRRSTP